VSVTYSLNRLQRIASATEYSVTLNRKRPIDASKVIRTFEYTHPRYTLASCAAQRRMPEINGQRRTWFCGAYLGYGFHEDGHVAGLEVARKLGGS
jgi:predicted NAD/FAD-binding protein